MLTILRWSGYLESYTSLLTLFLEFPIFLHTLKNSQLKQLLLYWTRSILNSINRLECLTSHICPDYKDLLIQIRNGFSSKSQGLFVESYRKLGDRLSIYKYNDSKFVLLDSRQNGASIIYQHLEFVLLDSRQIIPHLVQSHFCLKISTPHMWVLSQINKTARLLAQHAQWPNNYKQVQSMSNVCPLTKKKNDPISCNERCSVFFSRMRCWPLYSQSQQNQYFVNSC